MAPFWHDEVIPRPRMVRRANHVRCSFDCEDKRSAIAMDCHDLMTAQNVCACAAWSVQFRDSIENCGAWAIPNPAPCSRSTAACAGSLIRGDVCRHNTLPSSFTRRWRIARMLFEVAHGYSGRCSAWVAEAMGKDEWISVRRRYEYLLACCANIESRTRTLEIHCCPVLWATLLHRASVRTRAHCIPHTMFSGLTRILHVLSRVKLRWTLMQQTLTIEMRCFHSPSRLPALPAMPLASLIVVPFSRRT